MGPSLVSQKTPGMLVRTIFIPVEARNGSDASELHKRLKFFGIQRDTTMNALILRAVEEYLSKSGYERNAEQ